MPKYCLVLLLAAALLFARSSSAQEEDNWTHQPDHALVYATFSLVRASGIPTYSGVSGASVTSPNLDIGATFNVHHFKHLGLGIDVRHSNRPRTSSLNQSNGDSVFLVGVRTVFHPRGRFEPYAQISFGDLSSDNPNPPAPAGSINYNISTDWVATEYLGGIDLKLAHHVSLRLVEIGGGHAIQTATEKNNGNQATPGLFTFDTGVVFHF